jgi:hypothetical protein
VQVTRFVLKVPERDCLQCAGWLRDRPICNLHTGANNRKDKEETIDSGSIKVGCNFDSLKTAKYHKIVTEKKSKFVGLDHYSVYDRLVNS